MCVCADVCESECFTQYFQALVLQMSTVVLLSFVAWPTHHNISLGDVPGDCTQDKNQHQHTHAHTHFELVPLPADLWSYRCNSVCCCQAQACGAVGLEGSV